MIKLERKFVVQNSVRKVFAFLANPENFPAYDPMILKMQKISEGPVALGTLYKQVTRALGWRIEVLLEVSEYEPDRRISFTAKAPGFVQIERWSFSPALANTRITAERVYTASGVMRASEAIDALILNQNEDTRIERLKRVLSSK